MEALFWSSVALIVYVYAGYPALLAVWARLSGPTAAGASSSSPQLHGEGSRWPGVTVIIAARDEARRLPDRIDNILASSYAGDLQVVVASDGSSDDTMEVLARIGSRVGACLDAVTLPPGGKAAALNAAVARARYPILVFADARQRFAADAIRRLVGRFGDERIGAVAGELVIAGAGSTIGDGVGAYWAYETWLRRHEATVGSTLGVSGAIYAMRRELWRALPANTILDDVLAPMRVVLGGRRVVFEGGARAYDDAAGDAATELRRKVRTLAGNFQLLALEPRLLLPIANPVWLQFVSHKLGRLLVPYALVGLLVASVALTAGSAFYAVACAGQLAFYGLAAYGAVLDRRRRHHPAASGEVFREAA